jgi:phage N-6-adenine-methyltransferase
VTKLAIAAQQALSVLTPDKDAVEIGDLYRKGSMSLVESAQYYHACGLRLIAKRDALNHGDWLQWLSDNADVLGFKTPRTAQLLMKAASNTKLPSHLDETFAVTYSRQLWGNDDDEGGTPSASDDRDNVDRGNVNVDRGNVDAERNDEVRAIIAAHSPQAVLQAAMELGAKPHVHRALGTGATEWYTPAEYIEAARDVLGSIDLDPASSEIAQRTVRATAYFTQDDDGLTKEWRGRVWLNPPYGGPFEDLVTKLMAEYGAGRVTEAILLTHNFTDTVWFHEAVRVARVFCLPRGRIKFVGPDGNLASPTNGQCFFYFGNRPAAFAARFADTGLVARVVAVDQRVGRDGRRRTLPPKAAAAPKTDDKEVAQLIGDLLDFTFNFSQKITAWRESGHDCGREPGDALMFTIHQCADEVLRLAQAIDGR